MLSLRNTALGIVALLGFVPSQAAAATERTEPTKRSTGNIIVHVNDEAGKPVEKFSAYQWTIQPYGFSMAPKQGNGVDGKVTFQGSSRTSVSHMSGKESPTPVAVLISAPDHAFTLVRLPEPKDGDDVTTSVKLERGRDLEITLKSPEGTALPEDIKPVLFLPEQGSYALRTISNKSDGEAIENFLLNPSSSDGAKYVFRIPGPDNPPTTATLLINHSGFLRGFLSKPIELDRGTDSIEIDLPQPVSVSAVFEPAPDASFPSDSSPTLSISTYWRIPGAEYYSGISYPSTDKASDSGAFKSLRIDYKDLAPSPNLSLSATAGPVHQYPRKKGVFPFQKQVRLSLKEGESTGPIKIEYRPFDVAQFKGDYTAVVTIQKADGSPLDVPTSYSLQTHSEQYGWIEPFEGITPTTGPLVIENLAGGPGSTSWRFIINQETAGRIELKGEEKRQEFTVKIPPTVGDTAPDIEMTDILTSAPMKLSDYKGQVVLLDFWATWCGPCQEPMQENQEIMQRRANDWKGKAVILGCSIDDEMDTVAKHVKSKGWTALPQGWASAGGEGWQSSAAKDYGISGIPTVLLIGKDGKILYRGHPAGFGAEGGLEKRIDDEIAKK